MRGSCAAVVAKMDRLYTDVDAHTAEAARRFGLVGERWDAVEVVGGSEGGTQQRVSVYGSSAPFSGLADEINEQLLERAKNGIGTCGWRGI